jgi:hypothetical protein
MKKTIFMILATFSVFWLVSLFGYNKNLLMDAVRAPKAQAAASQTQLVTLTVNVIDYLSFTTNSGGSVAFGNLIPGTPNCDNGTIFLVSTNASNGYKMTPSDGSGTNSALKAADNTYIADYAGTIATPTLWPDGTTYGLGTTLWSGVQREAAWSAGGVATGACNAASTKWAGIAADSTSTSGHTVTGFISGPDTTYWGWKVNVPNTQKTGLYTGAVTFTVVNVLS